MDVLRKALLNHNLASIFLKFVAFVAMWKPESGLTSQNSQEEGQYITSAISLGSRADSYYEYLL